jgi:hypothetical protein
MSEAMLKAIQNAAASSAMEGMPLDERDFEMIRSILEGEISLQDYMMQITAHARKS